VNGVVEADLLEEHRDFVTVRRRPVVELDHRGTRLSMHALYDTSCLLPFKSKKTANHGVVVVRDY
jgi:hypothetical protein